MKSIEIAECWVDDTCLLSDAVSVLVTLNEVSIPLLQALGRFKVRCFFRPDLDIL